MKPTQLKCPKCHRKFDAINRAVAPVVRKCRTPDPEHKVPLSDADRQHLQRIASLGAGSALLHAAIAATPRLFQPSQPFNCPWCQTQLTVMTMVIMANAVEPNTVRTVKHSKLPNEAVAQAGVNIALNAFGEAVREQARLKGASRGTLIGVPKDMLHHFDRFLRFASSKEVSHSIIREMQRAEPEARFQVWRAEGIALVTRNDEMYRFLPGIVLEREPPREVIELEVVTLPEVLWLKSKNGYLPPGNRLFMGQLRGKSKGSFSKPNQ